MKSFLKFVGLLLIVGVVFFGILYLMDSTGVAGRVDPSSSIGQILREIQDALTGIQESISRMLRSFTY